MLPGSRRLNRLAPPSGVFFLRGWPIMTSSPALVRRVLAPDGSVLTLADLPQPDAQRWVASRKAIVVAAVRGGLLLDKRRVRPLPADHRGVSELADPSGPHRPPGPARHPRSRL